MKAAALRSHILLVLIFGCARLAWAQSPFTVEQVISSPFPSELVSAVHGSRVAWVFDAKGVRNVWVADGPDFAQHRTSGDALQRGRRPTHCQPAPDARRQDGALCVGQRVERRAGERQSGELDKGRKQQVFAVDVDAKDANPRLLGEMGCPEEDCEDIQISPDGKWAVWSAKKKLWLASVDGKQQAKELAVVRGTRGSTQMVAGWQAYRIRERARRA